MPRLLLLALLSAVPSAAEPLRPWVSFEIPDAQEPAAIKALEARGLTVIAWSNALVDISVFQGTEERPLATLSRTLTPADPRWDPWLRHLDSVFHPRSGSARVWVEAGSRDEAASALGSREAAHGPVPPRGVTGWMIVAAALFYLTLRLFGQGWPQWRAGIRGWAWFPSTLGAAAVGALMVWGGPAGPVSGGAPQSPVTWERHRWYQEALPYGAAWDDWTEGKPWTYPQVERKGARLTEEKAVLPATEPAGIRASFEVLDGHQAARIFGIANP